MSPEVRVHLRLGSVRLHYEGTQPFYEKHVESLVASAASISGTAPATAAVSDPAPVAPPPAVVVAPHAALAPTNGAVETPSAAPVAPSFVPQSGELGRFIRRLGPEAADADRQIVALAFYLWNYEKRETFGTVELAGCYKALGMKAPDGVPGILLDLTDRRRFLEAASPESWRLSRKGENYVKTRLLVA